MSSGSQQLFAKLFRQHLRAVEERLAGYRPEQARATGLLPNRQLAPLQLSNVNLFEGLLGLGNGGTNADLSETGAGVLFQASAGADVTVGDLPFDFIDFGLGFPDGAPLIYSSDGSATFTALNLSDSDAVTGQLSPGRGGTGVNNSTRTLTINTNSGTLGFSAASSTLTIPATGTAALLGTAQTFSANQTIAATLDAQQLTRIRTTASGNGYGLRFWDATDDFGAFQCLDLSGSTSFFFSANRQFDGSAWQQLNARVGSTLLMNSTGLAFFSFAAASSTPVRRWFVSMDGYQEMSEITAPAAPAANGVRIYAEDNGAGKTRLMALFSSGAAQQIAIQP
jgi:hypothetical protein